VVVVDCFFDRTERTFESHDRDDEDDDGGENVDASQESRDENFVREP
jgi:hypothetical protein